MQLTVIKDGIDQTKQKEKAKRKYFFGKTKNKNKMYETKVKRSD